MSKTRAEPEPPLREFKERMEEFDALPIEVRDAINGCPFWVHVSPRRGIDWYECLTRLKAIDSREKAEQFNLLYRRPAGYTKAAQQVPLPQDVEEAMTRCKFQIEIIPHRHMAWATVLEDIAKVKTAKDAQAFTEKYTRR